MLKNISVEKAMYFKDTDLAEEILKSKMPDKVKALSYKVKHYDETTWEMVQRQVVFTGCPLKFKQNEQPTLMLKETKGVLMEVDKYFLCGLAIFYPPIEDRNAWKGENVLGDILCKVWDSF